MTAGWRYVGGLAVIAAAALLLSFVLPRENRAPLLAALGIALAVQGPLGWWLVRSVGTQRFLHAWGLGLGARVALLGGVALVVVPALHQPAAPLLVPLAALLGALLAVEVVVVVFRSREPAKR